ncbi:NADP-dependent malic enzyme [Brevundimonas lutea]|uniref:NADP-dependent malic enzyme n=1 Tax=Brevundimonas lutea TaxID=2293980 RepID=UPI000F034F7C|nr:NADP-dependent malic enzyme [Brevundimonas lutea]
MTDLTEKQTFTAEEALDFHREPTPGKISMAPTKPMATQRDLSLAYSPGVAVPVLAIAEDADRAYDYTSKGNLVAVISNGTAILGLGNLGHMASKPVMEGKSVLFKRFADVDSFDVEVKTTDPDEFVTVVKNIGDTWGGINLEDIKSPECFVIESELQDLLDIPVFHDDQHGTAIISTAGLINACHIAGKKLEDVRVVLVGAGAAGLSSIGLMKAAGVRAENTVILDRDGVVYKGRDNVDQWKAAHATDTPLRTLEEAMVGADVVIGLAAKGAITKDMVASMAPNPIIFAMANPDPEITPEEVAEVRSDAIVATGRSDYPNQVNNVLGFPYIFRGALDVRARQVNHEMKVACAEALAALAREDVPDEVAAAYSGRKLKFGREYIIPTPFDPRLIWYIPPFVAQAAMDTGVARKPIEDMNVYRAELRQRLDPSAALMQNISSAVRASPNKRIVFAEGEETSVIRAAWAFKQQELGTPILVGREDLIRQNAAEAGLRFDELGIEIVNARVSDKNVDYTDFLYERLQRRGYLRRDVQRMINQDRNYFGAAMLARGDADAMVTGTTRNFNMVLKEVRRVLDVKGDSLIGVSVMLAKGRTLFVADTSIHELPDAQELADIAIQAAATVRKLGRNPRVAFLSYSTFGNPPGDRGEKVREAIRILDAKGVDFEYEGEMPPELALDPAQRSAYPFMRLSRDANVLVMPAIHSASISTRLVQALGGATVIGPLLVGLEKSVQIVSLGASVSEIITAATFAAYEEGAAQEI